MKTFDKKDVYSWSNSEEAKQYIGKEGYFSNNLSGLKIKVRNCDELSMLENIDSYGICCFNLAKNFEGFGLFLPANKVKEVEEKKWRPFKSIDEFTRETGLGLLSIVRYRYIIGRPRKLTTTGFGVITDFCTCSDETYYITIGDTSFNLNELFNYEYFDQLGKWQPFGVLENES